MHIFKYNDDISLVFKVTGFRTVCQLCCDNLYRMSFKTKNQLVVVVEIWKVFRSLVELGYLRRLSATIHIHIGLQSNRIQVSWKHFSHGLKLTMNARRSLDGGPWISALMFGHSVAASSFLVVSRQQLDVEARDDDSPTVNSSAVRQDQGWTARHQRVEEDGERSEQGKLIISCNNCAG